MSQWIIEMEEAKRIGELLVGAAHADGRSQKEEEAAIRMILAGMMQTAELPEELSQHLRQFDPASLDLERCCAALSIDTPQKRRKLLELVATVADVDHIHDLDEGHYIIRLARYVGATRDEYADLAAEATSSPDGSSPPPVPHS